ncbi:hypothetical protein M0R72_14330 [Candidatus Pacearchaeota archaeon]|jgi:hypothetical protein|nr:hypothetical protein [Candidatus Pacearchaeota archaeon]
MIDHNDWRLQTDGGIRYKLVDMSGSFEADNAEAKQTYIIRSQDLMAFVLESFPLIAFMGNTITIQRARSMPGYVGLLSRKVSFKAHTEGKPIDPFGVDGDAPDGTYEPYLTLDVDYTSGNCTEPDQDDPITFLEISSTASTNFLADTMGSFGAVWVSAPGTEEDPAVDIDVPSSVIETSIEWSFRWPQVPYEYFSDTLITRIRDRLGKVNSGPTKLFSNAPAETILFLGYSISQSATWNRKEGVTLPPLNVDFKFLEKNFMAGDWTGEGEMQVTHNHIYRKGCGWRRLLINGLPIFATTDMDGMFTR